jgi:hypothetical protein
MLIRQATMKNGGAGARGFIVSCHAFMTQLRTSPSDTTSKLNVFRHDGDSLDMDRAQVGIFEQTHQVAPLVITKTILYKMQNRDGMLLDKLAELFVKATRVQHTKYDLISLLIDDQDKLDETYNIEKNIERTRHAMGNYDYDNVFNIVEQNKTPGSLENLVLTKTRDLFKDYAILTPDEVVWSNGSKSTFITVGSGKAPVCWNCGGAHKFPDCPLPKNQENISEGKKKMQEAMKKTRKNGSGNGGNGGNCGQNFRKPSVEEKNCQTIDGSAMFYHKKTERWINDRFPVGVKVTVRLPYGARGIAWYPIGGRWAQLTPQDPHPRAIHPPMVLLP